MTVKPRHVVTIVSWALYDLANQFFALNIVSLYFVRWVTLEKGVPEIYYGIAFGIASFCVALLSPLFGSLSDYTHRKRFFLILFTLISVVFTMLIGTVSQVWLALVWFGVAYVGCHMGVVFYNALLADIVSPRYVGLVSGVGRMFGYAGALVALYLIKPVVIAHGYHATFIPTGLLFLLFSLPCLVLVRDRAAVRGRLPWRRFFTRQALRQTIRKLHRALSVKEGEVSLPYFLRAVFLSLAAVNTVLVFMSVYATVVFNLGETGITHLIAFSTFFAIAGSLSAGVLSDWMGQRRFLIILHLLWIGSLLFGALLVDARFYLVVGALVGLALGGIWVVLRAYVIKITPPDQIGEVFGLFNLLGYLSGIVGALFWGGLLLLLHPLGAGAYRITLASLSIFLLGGVMCIVRIPPDAARRREKEEQG